MTYIYRLSILSAIIEHEYNVNLSTRTTTAPKTDKTNFMDYQPDFVKMFRTLRQNPASVPPLNEVSALASLFLTRASLFLARASSASIVARSCKRNIPLALNSNVALGSTSTISFAAIEIIPPSSGAEDIVFKSAINLSMSTIILCFLVSCEIFNVVATGKVTKNPHRNNCDASADVHL